MSLSKHVSMGLPSEVSDTSLACQYGVYTCPLPQRECSCERPDRCCSDPGGLQQKETALLADQVHMHLVFTYQLWLIGLSSGSSKAASHGML